MSDWYYAVNNEQKGPVNESELKAQLASNQLPSDTLVWKEGMDNWTAASQVPAFIFREPPAPADGQVCSPYSHAFFYRPRTGRAQSRLGNAGHDVQPGGSWRGARSYA